MKLSAAPMREISESSSARPFQSARRLQRPADEQKAKGSGIDHTTKTREVGNPTVPFRGTFRGFANRSYACLWLANCLADTSRWMQMTLLAWLVLELTDSSWHVSLVGFFLMLPNLVLGLVGGVLADGMDRRRLLMITLGASIAASLALTTLLAAGAVQAWHAYLTVLINGAAWAVALPSRRALIFDLQGAAGVTNGVALDTLAMNVSRVLGPGLGGVLITLTGVAGGYGIVALFYAAGFALLWPLRVEPLLRHENPDRSIFRNLLDGFRYILRIPSVLAILWVTVVMNLLLFPYVPLVAVLARDVLHVGPSLMGILQAAQGLGAVVGAILIASAVTIVNHGRIFVGGAMLSLIGLALFSVSHWYTVSFPSLLCLGLGASGFATMQAAMVMLVSKEDMRGRALGVVSLAIGAGPIGSLLLGATASAVGPVLALGINALLGIVAVVGIAMVFPVIMKGSPIKWGVKEKTPHH